jgi:hypothetical protein
MKKSFYPSLISNQFFAGGAFFILGIGVGFIALAWSFRINLFVTIDALLFGLVFIYIGLSQYRKAITVTENEIIIDKSIYGSVHLTSKEIFSLGIGRLTKADWFPYYAIEYTIRQDEHLYSVSLRVWTKGDIIKVMEYIKETHPEITVVQYEPL